MLVQVDFHSRDFHRIPDQLTRYLDNQQWQCICSAVESSNHEGLMYTLGFEVGFCCFTGIFCVFFCHPCFQAEVTKHRIDFHLMRINEQMFSRQHVLTRQGNFITINTDLLNPIQQFVVNPYPVATVVPTFYNNSNVTAAHPSCPVYDISTNETNSGEYYHGGKPLL